MKIPKVQNSHKRRQIRVVIFGQIESGKREFSNKNPETNDEMAQQIKK